MRFRSEAFLAGKRKRGAVPFLTHSTLEYRPHGVVGLIVPWNYPFLLSAGDAIQIGSFPGRKAQAGRRSVLNALHAGISPARRRRPDCAVELSFSFERRRCDSDRKLSWPESASGAPFRS